MAARKTSAKKTTKSPAPKKPKAAAKAPPKGSAKTPAKTKGGGEVSAESVNMGHIFALRPKVPTSFRPEDLRRARSELRDEGYASIQDAARAVAEKALETSNKKPSRHGIGRG
ncbi:MAG: hypothetical protein QNK05_21480 [Myxococcota bacterium]|nr:hypothetical protein [Myxococcota bacterium]